MNKLQTTLYLLIIAIASLCLQCTTTQVSGGTIETTNGDVKSAAVYANGSPAAFAHVRLRPANYLADSSNVATSSATIRDTMTGEGGEYSFKSIDSGEYVIEVNNGAGKASLCNVKATGRDTILKTQTLAPVAVIAGKVALVNKHEHSYVRVYGLERYVLVDSVYGVFTFSDLPAGTYHFSLLTRESKDAPVEIADLIATSAETTSVVTINTKWPNSKKLYFNTTSQGAAVVNNVVNFPVLVRLNNSNFEFSKAKSNGTDIRFVNQDNMELPYEIEHWDAASGYADVWVKVDTVYGNDSTHFMTMYYGNPAAESVSNSIAVFDTANGFQGVWHMNQPGGEKVLDATVNKYHGTPYGMNAASSISGATGMAYTFDGSTSYIAIDQRDSTTSKLNFKANSNYTVSAWVSLDTLYNSQTEVIVEKGTQRPSEYVLTVTAKKEFYFIEYESNPSGWNNRIAPASTRTWTYLVGVKNGTSQYLYADGICVDSVGLFSSDTLPRGNAGGVTIGRNPYTSFNSNYLKGAIDEVQLSNVSRSADWIKLCAMNQKRQDVLVKFK